MNYSYKYRLYPSDVQQEALEDTLETCRRLYNKLLSDVKDEKPITPKYQKQKELPKLKSKWDKLSNLHSRVVQMVLQRLYNNIESMSPTYSSELSAERLRFKGKGWYKTFTYHQSGFDLYIDNQWCDSLRLSKIGTIPINYHRELPDNCDIKQVKIKRERNGEWYAIFGIEVSEENTSHQVEDDTVFVGAGINSYSIDSKGLQTAEPDYSELQKKREKFQQKLQKKNKGSSNYTHVKEQLGSVELKIERKQTDYLHKLSTYYVKNYSQIIVESRYIGRKNSSWWRFIRMLEYKAERANISVVRIDPNDSIYYYCEDCEVESSDEFWVRDRKCPSCGESTRGKRIDDIHKIISDEDKSDLDLGQVEDKPVDILATVEDLESSSGGMVESGSSIRSRSLP